MVAGSNPAWGVTRGEADGGRPCHGLRESRAPLRQGDKPGRRSSYAGGEDEARCRPLSQLLQISHPLVPPSIAIAVGEAPSCPRNDARAECPNGRSHPLSEGCGRAENHEEGCLAYGGLPHQMPAMNCKPLRGGDNPGDYDWEPGGQPIDSTDRESRSYGTERRDQDQAQRLPMPIHGKTVYARSASSNSESIPQSGCPAFGRRCFSAKG